LAGVAKRTATASNDSIRNIVPERATAIQCVRYERGGSFDEGKHQTASTASSAEQDYGVRSSEGLAGTAASAAAET
jgi:hypothetical protein